MVDIHRYLEWIELVRVVLVRFAVDGEHCFHLEFLDLVRFRMTSYVIRNDMDGSLSSHSSKTARSIQRKTLYLAKSRYPGQVLSPY